MLYPLKGTYENTKLVAPFAYPTPISTALRPKPVSATAINAFHSLFALRYALCASSPEAITIASSKLFLAIGKLAVLRSGEAPVVFLQL